MEAPSWIDGSLDEAIEKLAAYEVFSSRIRKSSEKQAAPDWDAIGSQLQDYASRGWDWVQDNPAPGGALLGAGAGGLLGGAMSMNRPEDERQPFQSALTGALAGAGVGGGTGLLYQMHGDKLPSLLPDWLTQTGDEAADASGAADVGSVEEANQRIQELQRELEGEPTQIRGPTAGEAITGGALAGTAATTSHMAAPGNITRGIDAIREKKLSDTLGMDEGTLERLRNAPASQKARVQLQSSRPGQAIGRMFSRAADPTPPKPSGYAAGFPSAPTPPPPPRGVFEGLSPDDIRSIRSRGRVPLNWRRSLLGGGLMALPYLLSNPVGPVQPQLQPATGGVQ